MLAAVALGCAQAGWSLAGPGSAHGSADASSADENRQEASLGDAEIRSPFAPDARLDEGASNAALAYLATIQLSGVRVSTDAARSGAIFTLQDGAQRAFVVGQDLTAGVTLTEVRADGVRLGFEGGDKDMVLAQPATFSFANAMMGRGPAPEGAASSVLAETQPAPASPLVALDDAATPFMASPAAVAAPASASLLTSAAAFSVAPVEAPAATFSAVSAAPLAPSAPIFVTSNVAADADGALTAQPDEMTWFAAMAAQASDEGDEGIVVRGPVPARIAAIGLREGDVITAVNGVPVSDRQKALLAASSGAVELAVRRGAETQVVLKASLRSPA
ncbi:MAG: PDZ domain-containing protein [Hyphomonadaceae bacterium]|nr:PDZ domain-containing protein [Hyphomonadaceae bacterium]